MTRPWTEDVKNEDGSTTITLKRCCNGCGTRIGDVTDDDFVDGVDGLADVRGECPTCSPLCPVCTKPISQADLDNDIAHYPHDEDCTNDEQGGEYCGCERKPVHDECCRECAS